MSLSAHCPHSPIKPNQMNEPDKIGKAFEVHDRYGTHMECLSCGSEMEFEKCDNCKGTGEREVIESDPTFLHGSHSVQCDICYGKCGDHWCPNSKCKTSIAQEIVPNPNRKAQLVKSL